MTTLDRTPGPTHSGGHPSGRPDGVHRLPWPQLLAVAAGAGVLLGVASLWWIERMPYPVAELADSSAVWAAAAWALAAALRTDAVRGAVAGVVMLVVAVEAFYLVEARRSGTGLDVLTDPHTVAWLWSGVLAGALFGAAGAWSSRRPLPLAALGLAVGAAVLVGEALVRMEQVGVSGAYERVDGVVSLAGLMVLAGAVLLLSRWRRPLVVALAALLTLPLALACAAGFAAVGFSL